MAEAVHTLSGATVELFYTDSEGAIIEPAAYTQPCCADLKLTYRFDEITKRPTGAPFPITRHINEEHLIEMGGTWVLDGAAPLPANAGDFEMAKSRQMILRVGWEDQGGETHTRTYYGVTATAADLASKDVMEFGQSKKFRAQYFVAS